MPKVIVEVYKPTGKYYTTGEYETACEAMYQVFEEVEGMAMQGNIPGLCQGSCWTSRPSKADWLLRVDSPDHPAGYPGMIQLFRDEHGHRTTSRKGIAIYAH